MDYLKSYISSNLQRGLNFHQNGRLVDAQKIYQDILKIQPSHADALNLLGVIFYQTGKLDESAASIKKAIKINANFAAFQLNLANTLIALEQFDEALLSCNKAIQLQADYPLAYSTKGALLQKLNRAAEALENYSTAISMSPASAEFYYNRANAHKQMEDFELAIHDYFQAIAYRANFPEAHLNCGDSYLNQGKLAHAIRHFDEAISLRPHYAQANWAKSIALLLSGDFEHGLPLHEWRWKLNEKDDDWHNFAKPVWDGTQELHGKTILIHTEQGLGDAIQFARYAANLADLGAKVILQAPAVLLDLFASLNGVDTLVSNCDSLTDFDYFCPMLSLPGAFKTTLGSIPAQLSYLSAAESALLKWGTILGERKSKRVGIVWSGNASLANDKNRSIRLDQLLKAIPTGWEIFSLQTEVRPHDALALTSHPEVKSFPEYIGNFSDTAAICQHMDIVVSVDTSIAHLSAALGRPTWILLPFAPDWRWMLHREDSPWYPTATLFRQERIAEWEAPLNLLREKLASYA